MSHEPPAIFTGLPPVALDAVVLALGTAASIGFATMTWWWGFVIAFVVAHFFLFCNVVRMARPLELTWAAVFVVLAGATIAFDTPGWLVTAAMSLVVTVVVVVVEMRKPSYHGVGWRWVNPGLSAWWEARVGADGTR